MPDAFDAPTIEFLADRLRTLATQAHDAGDPLYAELLDANAKQLIAESPFHQTFPDDISYAAMIVTGIVTLSPRAVAGIHLIHELAYLLHRCGAALDISFHYDHGPRSDQLAIGIEDARADRLIRAGQRRTRHGSSYSLFTGLYPKPDKLGDLSAARAAAILQQAQGTPQFALELATSVLFLRDDWDYYGKGDISPVDEIARRRPLTATADRIAQALSLLQQLGLHEPSPLLPASHELAGA